MDKEKEEHEALLDSLYPIGKERWIKVLIKDRDICLKTFMWGRENKYEGYTVTAIGVRDEYVPQISALADIEDELMPILLESLQEHQVEHIRKVFKQKKEELKQRVILTPIE